MQVTKISAGIAMLKWLVVTCIALVSTLGAVGGLYAFSFENRHPSAAVDSQGQQPNVAQTQKTGGK